MRTCSRTRQLLLRLQQPRRSALGVASTDARSTPLAMRWALRELSDRETPGDDRAKCPDRDVRRDRRTPCGRPPTPVRRPLHRRRPHLRLPRRRRPPPAASTASRSRSRRSCPTASRATSRTSARTPRAPTRSSSSLRTSRREPARDPHASRRRSAPEARPGSRSRAAIASRSASTSSGRAPSSGSYWRGRPRRRRAPSTARTVALRGSPVSSDISPTTVPSRALPS